MIKKFTRILLLTFLGNFALFTASNGYAQCNVTANWTFDPPIPLSGAYDAGQTIEICLEITNYGDNGANWLHGIVFDFPDAYDESSVVITDAPDACGGAGGNWGWYESVTGTGNNASTWGPGFFYDVNSGGPLDGNPGNNFGDFCTNEYWFMCFEVTLSTECGGPGNPLNNQSIIPEVELTGDGESGSWGNAGSCDLENTPAGVNVLTVNCCDAEPGTSPGTLNVCDNGTFDLIDELLPPIDLGGTWAGPAGWTPTPDGTFDPTTDPIGEYSYSVVGTDGCIVSSTITMAYINLGVLTNQAYCNPAPKNLFDYVATVPLPNGGTWYYPGFPTALAVVPGGIVDPATNPPSGDYTYVFQDGSNCTTRATISLIFSTAGASGEYTEYDYCEGDGTLCPFDVMGGNPSAGGQWVRQTAAGANFGFYPNSTAACQSLTNIQSIPNYEDGFRFIYILGAFPCQPSFDTLQVSYYPIVNTGEFTEVSVCETDVPFVLETLLDGTVTPGQNWVDLGLAPGTPPIGLSAGNIFDPSLYAPNTVLQLEYSGGLANSLCFNSTLLTLTILPTDADAGCANSITICASDPSFDLFSQLGCTPQAGGQWKGPGPAFPNVGNFFTPGLGTPGTYRYVVTSTCDADSTTLDINVIPTPNPGTSGTLDVCDNATNVALIGGLGAGVSPGGSWTNALGNPVGATVNGATVANGSVFTYTVGTAPCQLTSTVTVNLLNAVFAGAATGAGLTYCDSDASVDLFTLFNTPPSSTTAGTWAPARPWAHWLNP